MALALCVASPVRAEGTAPAATPGASTAVLIEARDAFRDGRRDKAMDAFTSLVESKDASAGTRAKAYLGRAYGYQRTGQYKAAVEDYTAALELDSLDDETKAVALYNRGLAHRKMRNATAAVEDFTNALFIKGDFAHAYMSRGLLMRETGRPLYALSDFEKAIKNGYQQQYAVLYAEGLAYEDLDRMKEAQAAYARSLMVKPDFAKARTRLADIVGVDPSELAVAQEEDGTAKTVTQGVARAGTPPKQSGADAIRTGSVAASDAAKEDLPDAVRPTRGMVAGAGMASDAREIANAADTATSGRRAGVAVPSAPDVDTAGRKPVKVASLNAGDGVTAASPEKIEGWLVQLSAQRKEPAAWDVWNKFEQRHAGIVSRYKPVVMRADLGTKGVYYRLRLAGFDTKSDAASVCSRLKAGGAPCFVTKAE